MDLSISFILKRFRFFSILKNPLFAMKIFWYKFFLKKEFRLSFAGLIKITTDSGKNLLILDNKGEEKYQLPGGVYHYYDSWIDHNILEQDEIMNDIPKRDMRFKVKKGKECEILSLIRKFSTGYNRELLPTREFNEELINTKIFEMKLFSFPLFNKIQIHKIDFDIHKGSNRKYCSFYRFEVFELMMNDQQKKFIEKLEKQGNNSEKYLFVSKKEIKEGLSLKGKKIEFPDYMKSIL